MKKNDSFWRRLSRKSQSHSAVVARSRWFRPQLERLEPRLTPSGSHDTLQTAFTPAPYGNATAGTLSDPSQVDLYILSGIKAGDQFQADLNASNGAGKPGDALRLFDSAGKQLAFQENQPGGDTILTFDATASGTYYIGVSSNGDYAYDPTKANSGNGGLADGDYSLTLNLDVEAITTQETPGNFSPATAQTISGATDGQSILGKTVVKGTYAIGETEYYRFTAFDTGGLNATVTPGNGTAFRPQLGLYSDQGQLLIQFDAAADGTAQLNQNLQKGTYYLGVSAVQDSGNASDDQSYILAAVSQPALRPNKPMAVGNSPNGVATGDFNHDGNTDLVVANYLDNTVSVLLSNGDGTFQPQAAYSVTDANGNGIGPTSVAVGDFNNVAVGDFNNDGNLDIVTANSQDNTVSVLLGNGDGTFQTAVTYSVTDVNGNGTAPQAVALAEIAGKIDIVTANAGIDPSKDGTVSVLLGNGDGTFQPAVTYAVGNSSTSVAVAEIDGRLDIVTANAGADPSKDGTVSVLLGNGDGTFQETAETFNVGQHPVSVAVGDFNGRAGIVTANNGGKVGTVSVLLDDGSGTFQQEGGPYVVGVQPQSVTLGQFNGHTDIVTANSYSNSVSVLLGNSDGTFQAAHSYAVGSFPVSVATGDFNHDNRPGLAVVNSSDNTVSVLFGRGDGTFISARPDVAVGQTPFSLATADFNRDGRADLVTANGGDNTVSVLLGNGDGTFQPALSNPVGNNPVSVAIRDFNGDGNPDLVVANYLDNTVSVLLGLGDGAFLPAVPYAVGRNPYSVAVGDFNHDEKLDVVTANSQDDTVSVLLGNGDGTFQAAKSYSVTDVNGNGIAPQAVTVVEIAGHVDIVTANSGDNTVSVLRGNGDGTFQTAVTYAVGYLPYSVAAGDFNNDNVTDLVVANFLDNTVSVLLGSGDGTFQDAVSYAAGNGPTSVAVGKFNKDGNLGIAVADIGNTISVLLGNGDGTFLPAVTEQASGAPIAVAVADFNNDGNLDVAAADIGDNTVSVLLGSGGGLFQKPTTYPVESAPGALAVYYDNSGNEVVVTTNPGKNDVSVLQGDPNGGNFQTAKTYTAGDDPVAVATVTDIFGNTDLFVANGSANTVSVLSGDANNFFGAPTPYSVTDASGNGLGPNAVAVTTDANFNDVVVTTDSDGYVSVLVQSPDGTTFGRATTYKVGSDPVAVALGYDSNFNVDIFVADYKDGTVTVLLGDANDNFTLGGVYQLDPGLSALAVSYDSQGNDVLAVTNALKNTASVLVGDPDGMSFKTAGSYTVGIQPDAVAISQDGNFNPDVIVANYKDGTVSVLLGNASDKFKAASSYPAGPNPIGVGLLYDSNFNLDIVTANAGDNTVSVLRTNESFHPSSQNGVAIRHVPFLVNLPDAAGNLIPDELILDGAGDLLFRQGLRDAPGQFAPPVVINQKPARDATLFQTASGWGVAVVDASGNSVSTYIWDPAKGGFDPGAGFATGEVPVRIAAADLTGSGRLGDLVVANAFGDSLTIALSGHFDAPITRFVGATPSDIAFTQRDGAIGPDVVVSNQASGDFSVLLNDATSSSPPTFSQQHSFRAGAGPFDIDTNGGRQTVLSQLLTASVLTGDFSGPGSRDVIVLNRDVGSITLLTQGKGGTYADPGQSPTYATSALPGQMALITLPGDTRPSVAVMMLDLHQIWIYRNDNHGGFEAPVKIDAGQDPSGFSVTTLYGYPALLVGNSYGDILTLLYTGDGLPGGQVSFMPDRAGLNSTPLAVGKTSDGQEFAVVADEKLHTAYLYYRIAGTDSFHPNPVPINSQLLLAPGAAQTFIVPGDPNPYLVVADSLSNQVLLYHYDPAKGFVLQGSPIQVGDDPVSVTVADINGDGVPDLIVANKGSNDVSVLIGNTTAGYWVGAPYQRLQSGGLGPVSVAVQDTGGVNGPNLLVTNGDGTVTQLAGIGAGGKGSGFFQDGNPQPMQTTKTITGTVYDPRSDQTFAMAADGTVSVLTNGVLTPLPLNGVTTLYAVDSAAGGSFLVAGFDNGTVELLSTAGTLIPGESIDFSAAPGALEVLQNVDNNTIDVFVTVAGSDVPNVVTFNLSGEGNSGDGSGGGKGSGSENSQGGFNGPITFAGPMTMSNETAGATSVPGFDLVLVATLLPGELTESLTVTVAAGPDAATFAVFLGPDGAGPDGAGGDEVVQITDAEPVDVPALAPALGPTVGDSPESAPLENYLLGVTDALEQRLQDKELKDGVEDFMDALKATLDQILRELPALPQATPPAKDVLKPTNASQAADEAPEFAAFELPPVKALRAPAAAEDPDVFLSADLPAVASPRWTPENAGGAWSATDIRPALLAVCLTWHMRTDDWRPAQEVGRRAGGSQLAP